MFQKDTRLQPNNPGLIGACRILTQIHLRPGLMLTAHSSLKERLLNVTGAVIYIYHLERFGSIYQ